jgi:hypothetical protein
LMNRTHSPCAAIERLKVPRRSQPSESAPHCSTIDEGRKVVMVGSMMALKSEM